MTKLFPLLVSVRMVIYWQVGVGIKPSNSGILIKKVLKKNILQRGKSEWKKQLAYNLVNWEYCNINITHPLTGSIYPFGKQVKYKF